LKSNFFDEKRVASCLHGSISQLKRIAYAQEEIDRFSKEYQHTHSVTLADEQFEVVRKALVSLVSIISSGPGTEKTLTIQAIMSAIKALSPDAVIRACAPTRKAAIRISELTGSRASTIHQMLKIGQFQSEIRGGSLNCDL